MSAQDKYIAFIPVRGGSKSIPLKNIKPINGRPLVYWTIDAAVKCSEIDRVYISTDSLAIKKKVEEYIRLYNCENKLCCIDRSPHTATDTASTESAILDFAEKYDFKQLILIQATNPLLTDKDLSKAIAKYEAGGRDSMLSVVRQKRFIWEETSEGAKPVNYDFLKRPRRQEFGGYLVENGAFYITPKELLMKSECRMSGTIETYEMEEETYFEIDEPSDWVVIEHLMHKKGICNPPKNTIKLFATDCDGCLTDAGMYYSEHGDELKKFSTLDGMGLALLREKGIKTAIITGEDTELVRRRAEKLKIDYLYMGVKDKLNVLNEIMNDMGISVNEVAYMGDDINDISVLKEAGMSFSVPNGREEAKSAAQIIVSREGGSGAVREAAEYILKYI